MAHGCGYFFGVLLLPFTGMVLAFTVLMAVFYQINVFF